MMTKEEELVRQAMLCYRHAAAYVSANIETLDITRGLETSEAKHHQAFRSLVSYFTNLAATLQEQLPTAAQADRMAEINAPEPRSVAKLVIQLVTLQEENAHLKAELMMPCPGCGRKHQG